MPDRTPSDLTDEELLEAILKAGTHLLHQAQIKNAEMGSLTDDPRWEAPTPLRFEIQLASLFFGAIDAFDVTTAILRLQRTPLSDGNDPLIRWMAEPTETRER